MIVILYRGIRRFWEPCLQNQHEFIYENFGTDVIYGMHFWDKQYERLTNRIIGETPKELPEFFMDKKVKCTMSKCPESDVFNTSKESKCAVLPVIESTKLAYKNALDLCPNMDENQLIVILRTDCLLKYKIPDIIPSCIGNWNRLDRQNPEKPEMGEVCIITRKWVLDKFVNLSLQDIIEITKGSIYNEHYFYKIHKHIIDDNPTLDENLHVALLRSNHISYCS